MKRTILILLSVVVLISGALSDNHIAGVLTLEDCLNLLEDRNPTLNSAKDDLTAADARLKIALGALLPSVSLGAAYSVTSEVMEIEMPGQTVTLPPPAGNVTIPGRNITFGDEDIADFRVTLEYPVYTGGRNTWNAKLAQVQSGLAYFQLQCLRQDLRARLRTLYFTYLKATKITEIVEETITQAQRHLNEIETRYQQGMAIQMEVLEARLTLNRSYQELLETNTQKEQARIALLSILNLPPDSPIVFSMEHWDTYPEDESQENHNLPLERRAEIGASNLAIAAAEFQIKAAGSNQRPHLYLSGTGNYGCPGLDQVNNEWMAYATAGLTLNFSLYRGGAVKAAIQEKQDLLNAAKERRQAAVRQIQHERQSAQLNLNTTQNAWQFAQKSYETAQERFQLVESMWRQGQVTETVYQDARESLIQSHLSLTTTILDYRLATAELIRANGEIFEQ